MSKMRLIEIEELIGKRPDANESGFKHENGDCHHWVRDLAEWYIKALDIEEARAERWKAFACKKQEAWPIYDGQIARIDQGTGQ